MEVLTDFPERLKRGSTVLIGPDHTPHKIQSQRWHNQLLLVTFRGISTPEEAAAFRNQLVYVRAADVPALEEGEYYHHQLIGLEVYSETGRLLGKVREIIETGSNDVLVIRPEVGKEVLVPFVEENLLKVDLDQGQIHIVILPGLVDDEAG